MRYTTLKVADNSFVYTGGSLAAAAEKLKPGTVCGQGADAKDAYRDAIKQAAAARTNRQMEKEKSNES